MNIKFLVFFGLLAVVICVGLVASDDIPAQDEPEKVVTARDRYKLPKLFNFDYFKQIFKKSYENLAEEMRRQKLFLGQAFRNFLSGVKYKHKMSTYYLATNHMSDWTPKEVADLDSRVVVTSDLKEVVLDKDTGKVLSEEPLAVDVNMITQEVADIMKRSSEPGYDIIAKDLSEITKAAEHARKRREAQAEVREEFSPDMLIKDKPVKVPEEVLKKMDNNPISNNPDYEPPEVISQGFLDNFAMPKLDDLREFDPVQAFQDLKQIVTETAADYYIGRDSRVRQPPKPEPLPDEIFNDHRGCMNPVSNQGTCGSCYAFAGVSYWEYQVCKATGKLFKFSEQYIVDCAHQVYNVFQGCGGGLARLVGLFYNHAGIELAKNYPYTARVGACPHANVTQFTPDTSPGFFRMKNGNILHAIPMNYVSIFLSEGPLFVTIGTKNGYHQYGGGVADGVGCCGPENDTEHCGTHAQVLVGDGREDGEEYWLLRNSYGTDWGEEGYYKLSKTSDCMHPKVAWKVGSLTAAESVSPNPSINFEHIVWQRKLF